MHMKSTSVPLEFPPVHMEISTGGIICPEKSALQTFCQPLIAHTDFKFVLVEIGLISASLTVASAQQQSIAGAESSWCIWSPIP